MNLDKMREFAEALLEILLVIKICLTTFWFWLPILYTCLFFFHLWMIFYIHPLTILIFPGILVLYSLYLDNQRIKIRYEPNDVKK
jgi:hypothetical protein